MALVSRDINVRVVDRLQKVKGEGVASERVNGEQVSCVDAVSEELEACRGGWHKIWGNSAHLRDTEDTVVSALEGSCEGMVGDIDVLEESANTGGMEGLDSVGWHLVSDEVEGEVDVLEEEGH